MPADNELTLMSETEYLDKGNQIDWRSIPRSKAFQECMEYFDVSDNKTRSILLTVDEAGQENIIQHLANKLYNYIVSKVYNIDFGEIPVSKGDIKKIPNYQMIVDCINVLGQILENYKQPTDQIDTINIALHNMVDRRDMFMRAYRLNVEMPIVTYNTMALAIVSAVSLLIAAHIEFIKQNDNKGYTIAFDSASRGKTRNRLMFTNLVSFNKMCASGEFDRAMKYSIDNAAILKHESMLAEQGAPEPNPTDEAAISVGSLLASAGSYLASGGLAAAKGIAAAAGVVGGAIVAHPVVASIVGVIGLILVFIKFIRWFVFNFYYYRTKFSDKLDMLSSFLYMNALNGQINLSKDESQKAKWIASQSKVADVCKSLADKLRVDFNTAEKQAEVEVKKLDSVKYTYDDVSNGASAPAGASTSLF